MPVITAPEICGELAHKDPMANTSTEINLTLQRQRFDEFLGQRHNTLAQFAKQLGLSDAEGFAKQPERYIEIISDALSAPVIEPTKKLAIATNLGYFIGEIFINRYDGEWTLCDDDSSSLYCHYLVNRFSAPAQETAQFSPMSAAIQFADMPPPRSLSNLLDIIDAVFRINNPP